MKKFKYTTKHLDFLRTGYLSMNIRDLAKAINKHFGLNKTEGEIKSALQNHKIRCGRAHKDRLINRYRLFSDEQNKYLKENYTGRSVAELTDLFNDKFGTYMKKSQIKTAVKNRKLISGRTGCFPKGHKSWNTGTKGLCKPNSGSFKKGSVPANLKPLGSEKICPRDGYVLMKVPEQDPHTGFSTRWKHKQVHVWEQNNGPVPDGFAVLLKDGDRLNCDDPDNLILVSRAELLRLNKHGYKDTPDELKPSVLVLAKLEVKTFEKTRRLTK